MLYSQGFVYTTDGKMYFTEAKSMDQDAISVVDGDYYKRIQKSDIVLIEYMEGGIEYVQPDKIQQTEAKAFDGDYDSFLAKDRKVYVPLSNTIIQNRWGAKRLRELLVADGYWKVVGCPEEADFILVYKFNESGSDHANLFINDRNNELIMETSNVGASDWVPTHAGIESAEKLHKYMIMDLIQANDKTKIRRKKRIFFWKYPWEKKHSSK